MACDLRKDALRTVISAQRAALPASQWKTQNEARTAHLWRVLGAMKPGTIALYASKDREPGTSELITQLASRGWTVLLPVVAQGVDWAIFTDWIDTPVSRLGIPAPNGARLGPEGLAAADLIIVPCLAVGRDGSRLGTGGGWYDRALLHRTPEAPVIALARSEEVFDSVPVEEHDLLVDGFVTEDGWSRR